MAIQKEEEEENKELCVCWKGVSLLECVVLFLAVLFFAVLSHEGVC